MEGKVRSMTQGPVQIFSEHQFSGTSVSLAEGETRFQSSFNDTTTSVRVALGYCAVLYEHANEFGGYGASVELLEDCPDLSVCGFERKTSCVLVFRTERPGYVWIRAALLDGQVMPGHWERARADGTSSLNIHGPLVVNPPIPPRTAPRSNDDGSAGGPQGGVVVRDHATGAEIPSIIIAPPPTSNPSGDGVVVRDHRDSKIKHVFVLMLENRSFDHMLGFADIRGTDAATGQPTVADGLTGSEFNSYNGTNYSVLKGAPDRAPHDPPHGFLGVLRQLCGGSATFDSGQAYPPINNSGFVAAYANSHPDLPDGAMRCFTPEQLPVLTTLAREFVICDRWFSSMPGPTEPNRWFVHAATAGVFDEAPSKREYIESMTTPWSGIELPGGTIFDKMSKAGIKWRIYAGDSFPNVATLKGVSRTFDIDEFDEDFASDVASPSYDAAYTFIEPSYEVLTKSDFSDGNSQHPLGSVKAGELLIKKTYEAIRKSPHWTSSLFIITYDEHGGFYDHVAPPEAQPTGSKGRRYGFNFDRLGPRVPAIVISPLIPKNLVDHRRYEHSSVVATLSRLFDLKESARSLSTTDLKHLASLDTPRTDTPMTLPDPARHERRHVIKVPLSAAVAEQPDKPLEDDPTGRVAATIASGLFQHLEIAPPSQHDEIKARVKNLKTQGEALDYLKEVDALVKETRQKAGIQKSARVRSHQ